MRKILSICACFLLVSVYAFADPTNNGRQPRQWDQAVSSVKLQSGGTDYTDNTTVFTNEVSTGNAAVGNAGYQGFMATDSAGINRTYYLWVDASKNSVGVLRFASFGLLTSNPSVYTSFPYGDWRNSTGFTSGVAVSTVDCNGGVNPTLC